MRLFGRCSSLAFALLIAAARPAYGQSETDIAMRRQLIEEATALARSGQNERALELATRASRIRMTPSLRAFVAAQQLATQRFVEAISSADLCVNEVRRDATVRDAERLVEDCARVSQQASSRVGRVRVAGFDTSLPNLEVRVNGASINAALVDVPIIANPGSAVVEVAARGYQPFRATVTIEPQQTVQVTVRLEREAAAGSADRAADPRQSVVSNAAAPTSNAATTLAPSRPRATSARSRVGPIVVMIAGGATAALGGAMFAAQVATFGDCQQTPEGNRCSGTTSIEMARPAVTFNRVAIVSTALGASALAAGVLWFVLASRTSSETPALTAAPVALADGAGVAIGGVL
ncbi:MAG: PEGA domain-containing protein [Myxococcales bacterium]|nr:PEGA domain-containing protein [Myxococcales bacterium]